MRISEIIVEGPAGQAAGQALGTISKGVGAVAGGIAGAPKRIAKGVASGAAAFDKLMSPSKWFSGSDDEPSNFEKDTAKNNQADAAAYKNTIKSVSQGITPNAQDISNLKQLAIDSKTPEEQEALKAASFGHRLSPEQVAIIKQVAARL